MRPRGRRRRSPSRERAAVISRPPARRVARRSSIEAADLGGADRGAPAGAAGASIRRRSGAAIAGGPRSGRVSPVVSISWARACSPAASDPAASARPAASPTRPAAISEWASSSRADWPWAARRLRRRHRWARRGRPAAAWRRPRSRRAWGRLLRAVRDARTAARVAASARRASGPEAGSPDRSAASRRAVASQARAEAAASRSPGDPEAARVRSSVSIAASSSPPPSCSSPRASSRAADSASVRPGSGVGLGRPAAFSQRPMARAASSSAPAASAQPRTAAAASRASSRRPRR